MKKRLLSATLATVLLLAGCGSNGTSNDNQGQVIEVPPVAATEEVEVSTENNTENATTEVSSVKEFDPDLMGRLTMIIPGDGSNLSIADMADNCLLDIIRYGDVVKDIDIVPAVENLTGKTPIELTYEGIAVGEEAECNRIKTADMEAFLSAIYGKNMEIPEGTDIAMASEFTNLDGYIAEWGHAYFTAFEGWDMKYEESFISLQDENSVELITNGKYYEVVDVQRDYSLMTVWNVNPESPLGWSLVSYQMDFDVINDVDGVEYGPGANRIDHDVESEVEQIKAWYYNQTSDVEKKVETDGNSGLTREYYYHDGELFFVFMSSDSEKHRLYYNRNELIRYIDTEKNTYDYYDYDGVIPAPSEILDLVATEGFSN